jgi:hypothetical protein
MCTLNVLFTIFGNIIRLTMLTDVPMKWVRIKREKDMFAKLDRRMRTVAVRLHHHVNKRLLVSRKI